MTESEQALRITFFSTVHPHPWSRTKGTFNRTMLEGLTRYAKVRAVVPVPWTEQLRGRQSPPPTSYDVIASGFSYLPRIDRMALARRMQSSLARTLAAEPLPDLILSYWVDPDGTAALAWGRAIGRPVVQIAGGSDVLLLANDPQRRSRIIDTLQQVDAVLAIGAGVRDAIVGLGIASDRVHVISRGVDRGTFYPRPQLPARNALKLPPGRPLLLWVGRMVPVKGLDVLLRAMASPEVLQSDVLLALVGDGPLRRRLERLASRLGIADRVIFAGAVDHAALPEWYAAADRLVLPSRSEGVPNVLLEGLASGRPFFASNVGGIPELTTAQSDLLPVGRADAWAARLGEWLRSPVDTEPLPEIPDHIDAAARLSGLLRTVVHLAPIP